MGFYKRYRDTFLVVLLLAVPFFFLRASIRKPEELNGVDRALVQIAAPVQYLASSIGRGLSEWVGEYFYLWDVGRDNNRLSREVARLEQEVHTLAETRRENDRLRKLIGLRKNIPVETVSALVTTKSPTEFFRIAHVVVDHGGAAIQENMPVIAVDGAVGLIKRVHGDSATVFLIADSGFGVDVVVPRTLARGYVRGSGDESSYTVKVAYAQRSDEIEVGDVFVTSGVGCRFPKGIPVARVTKVVKRDFGEYQEVLAEPTVDFSRMEEVLVVTGKVKDCPSKKRGR